MADTINGSVELVSGNESVGVVGSSWLPEDVPVVVRNLHGVRNLVQQTPQPRETGRVPLFQWLGSDDLGRDVLVLLWEEIPFEQTEIGQALAAAAINPLLPEGE